ncbi:MAG TPA: alkyl sulfatase dimerization domain-containing protein [Acidimicrobiales bacterium]|nr:alkyl sulfatase dimerization domain-containing protein [Acidimicrobiales bacterium]
MTDDALAQEATSHTRAANEAVRAALPLDDPRDDERNERGLVASEPTLQIPSDRDPDRVVWDADQWSFLSEGDAPPSVNPSLWRQSRLNSRHGVFRLAERIWQVRGYDISNISAIEGDTGWIVIDPLTSTETARAAMALLTAHAGERPVRAVIYTHSHADHFAGAAGVMTPEQAASGEVRVIAPDGFLEAAVSENVIAGPAMMRRAQYMYGNLLPAGPHGKVGSGLGQTLPRGGGASLIAPTELITETGQELVVDGVRIVFQYTPDTEAPAEMNFWFPDLKALCTAENCTTVMHNLYTPRGAKVRDALGWSKYIHEMLRLWGGEAELSFASHNWPRFGNDEIVHYLKAQRDLYRYLHDQTMRLANRGLTPVEIAEELDLPPSLAHEFSGRGYYGTVNHNAKAVYQRYLGWFDGNPANLHPHPPVETARRTVDYMGGADAVLARARRDFEAGEYRWVAQVVNQVVFADPDNAEARALQADALEQLGYQAEAGPWRNFYLTGAHELRHGVGSASPTAAGGFLSGMTVEWIFELLGVRLDGPAADGQTIGVNWVFTDTGERWVLRLENSALHHHEGTDDDADATLTMARTTLDAILMQTTTVPDEVVAGRVGIDGDADALVRLFALLEQPTSGFAIVTP